VEAGAEAIWGGLVERPVYHDGARYAGRNGQRRLLDHRARGAAAEPDAAEEGQRRDAEVAGDLDLGVPVDRVGDEPVDVLRLEARVPERSVDRLDGELHLAPARVLGELGRADAGDGGAVREPGGVHGGQSRSGRNLGSVRSGSTATNSTATGRPMRTSAGSIPMRLVTRRVPSASSTSATT